MNSTLSAKEARDNFSDLLGAVYYGKQAVQINKKGRTFAVVINPDEYNALKKAAKGQFFKVANDIQKSNSNVNPDTVLEDVTKEVEIVRLS